MSGDQLYSIGQMAKICNIPIQTLRYYDNIDLLKPAVVKDNGYRYYKTEQILPVNIIKGLRELNFSLEQINSIMRQDDIDHVLKVFQDKREELKREIDSLKVAEKNVAGYIENLQLYNSLEDDEYIEIKKLSARKVAFTRYRSPSNPGSFMARYNELHNIVEIKKWKITGSLMAVFHDHYTEYDYNNADIEVCVPVKSTEDETDNIRLIQEGKYLSKLHKGPYDKMQESYKYMLDWCSKNNYRIVGPAIEIYLVDFTTTKDPQKFITELQLPVKKSS